MTTDLLKLCENRILPRCPYSISPPGDNQGCSKEWITHDRLFRAAEASPVPSALRHPAPRRVQRQSVQERDGAVRRLWSVKQRSTGNAVQRPLDLAVHPAILPATGSASAMRKESQNR